MEELICPMCENNNVDQIKISEDNGWIDYKCNDCGYEYGEPTEEDES